MKKKDTKIINPSLNNMIDKSYIYIYIYKVHNKYLVYKYGLLTVEHKNNMPCKINLNEFFYFFLILLYLVCISINLYSCIYYFHKL
jgi:hypothetical protein